MHCKYLLYLNRMIRKLVLYGIIMFAISPGMAYGQVQVVTGKVISSEDGQGLPGTNVLIKGTASGTVTDAGGTFSIEVSSPDAVLVFSSIGYTPQEVTVGGRTSIEITLQSDVTQLSEIVVVGYGTVKKSDVTGSLVSVSAEQLQSVPVQSISQALQGRAAGVDVSMSNFRPGENPTIRIRGNRSLKATNNPLYVVDGIPLAEGAGINDFNPSDIQSIEVLKDASATAIYGSRGANGVILVTTKRGKAGRARISYDGYAGASSLLAPIDMLSGAEHAELRREANRNNNGKTYVQPWADPNADYAIFGSDPYMWRTVAAGYTWVDETNRIPAMRPITEAERAAYRAYYEQDLLRYPAGSSANNAIVAKLIDPDAVTQIPVYDPSKVQTTDWAKHVLRTGIKQSHQFSVSGGTDDILLKLAAGYYNEKGVQKNQGYKRYNLSLSMDYRASKVVRFGASFNGSIAEQNYGGGTDLYARAISQLPIAVPYDDQGSLILQPGGDALIFNPVLDVTNAIDDRSIQRVFGSFYGEITIAKGLRYRMNFGPDFRNNRRGRYFSGLTTERNNGSSQAFYDTDQRFNYVLENLVFYDKEFAGGTQILGVTLLQSIQDERFESSNLQVSQIPIGDTEFYNIGTSIADSPDAYGTNLTQRKLMSWMGRVNYTINNKYLLTATGRFDGSSVLAPGNKWDFFPSFAAAWKVHEESFISELGLFDELKLRAGYGKTGNSAVNPYSTWGSLIKTRALIGGAAAYGFRPDQLPNPALKWENTAQIDIGLDFGLFNGRISGSADVYKQNTSDLIMDRQLPTAGGFDVIQENIGKTSNKGVELSLSTINLDLSNGFKWTTDIIFAKNKEEIVELYGGKNDDIGNRWFIGEPLNVYYDWLPIGVWQTSEADAAKVYNRIPGQGKILDLDEDNDIDAADRMLRGNTVPKWTGSFVSTFSFKRFELSAFFYARYGFTIASAAYRPSLAGRYPENALIDYWTPVNPTNAYPRPNTNQERIDYPESYLYQDGTFVKLRQLSLSYTFANELASRLKMTNLNVYVTAYNPILWTEFKAGDPEFVPLPIGSINPVTNARVNTINDQLVGNNISEKSFVVGVRVGF